MITGEVNLAKVKIISLQGIERIENEYEDIVFINFLSPTSICLYKIREKEIYMFLCASNVLSCEMTNY